MDDLSTVLPEASLAPSAPLPYASSSCLALPLFLLPFQQPLSPALACTSLLYPPSSVLISVFTTSDESD